ncbi:XdhC/CoxF family protein [bacterium]|nr:XdhC/CoxF family protein [bacterium]
MPCLRFDDRGAEQQAPFPDTCPVFNDWRALFAALWPARAAVVLLTRNKSRDIEALKELHAYAAAKQPDWCKAFQYLGMMGSARRIHEVQRPLSFSIEGVHAPVGIEIGAETPNEIAVSICAALIRARTKN